MVSRLSIWPADCSVEMPPTLLCGHHRPCFPANIHLTRWHRSFPVVGPRIWNSLPTSLRQLDIEYGQFKRVLKTFLYIATAAH